MNAMHRENRRIMRTAGMLLAAMLLSLLLSVPAQCGAGRAENKYYTVQLGVFKAQQSLEAVDKVMTAKGIATFKLYSRGYHRLYTGSYRTRRQAEGALLTLRKKGVRGIVKLLTGTPQNTPASPKVPQAPQADPRNGIQIKNYTYGSDSTINGVLGGHSFFFYADKGWQPQKGSYVQLIFSQSDIKRYKYSTLTIFLNDIPIKTISLSDSGISRQVVRAELPADRIQKAYNSIRIKSYHRITEDNCSDDLNPGNWLVIHKDSYVHLEFLEKPVVLSLRDYPYPFLRVGMDMPINCTVVLPDTYTSAQANAAMLLAADLGRRERFRNLELRVVRYSELTNADKGRNLIYIGGRSGLPPELAAYGAFGADNGVLRLIKSPYDSGRSMLLLLSEKGDRLLDGIRLLGNDTLAAQLSGSEKILTQEPPKTQGASKAAVRKTLADLGYGDNILEGVFYQEASFTISLPRDKTLIGVPYVKLFMKYSKLMNFEKSSITVYLNDIPAGDMKLTEEKAEGDSFQVNIPDELRDKSFLELRAVFYMEPLLYNCKSGRNGSLWAMLSKESFFELPSEEADRKYLEYYPGNLIKDGAFNNLLLVLPHDSDAAELTMAANITAFLGHGISSLEGLKVIKDNEFGKGSRDMNLLLLGTAKANGVIRSINGSLHIGFEKGFDILKSTPQIPLLENVRAQAASIQLTASPWKSGRRVLTVTGSGEEAVSWAENYLKSFEFVQKLKGDAAVIDSLGNLQTAYFQVKKEKAANKSALENKKSNVNFLQTLKSSQARVYIAFIFMAVVLAAVGTIIIIRRNR